jgi:hypothetical protein
LLTQINPVRIVGAGSLRGWRNHSASYGTWDLTIKDNKYSLQVSWIFATWGLVNGTLSIDAAKKTLDRIDKESGDRFLAIYELDDDTFYLLAADKDQVRPKKLEKHIKEKIPVILDDSEGAYLRFQRKK